MPGETNMKKLLKTVVFVFLISNLFVSCDTEDNPKTDDDSKIVNGLAFDNETFYSNKSKWENLNVKNYICNIDCKKREKYNVLLCG